MHELGILLSQNCLAQRCQKMISDIIGKLVTLKMLFIYIYL